MKTKSSLIFVFLALACILLFLSCSHAAYAQQNSIKLLAVNDDNTQGNVVELDLNLADGSGNVFINTQPLSQIDTQISLRMAKTIACKTTDVYCLNKDFTYTINANSPIVAGPSAGAAITLLTISSLENQKLDASTAITGTINSGGVIGIVGGLKEKIHAAAENGLKRILIPAGEPNATSLIAYGKSLNATVIEVSDINDAYAVFTNRTILHKPLVVNTAYSEIMKLVSEDMCNRTKALNMQIENENISKSAFYENVSAKEAKLAQNLSSEADSLYGSGEYYSAASRCFGANVYYRNIILASENLSESEVNKGIIEINQTLNQLDAYLNSTKITKLGDLETYMIIKERIYDAEKNIESASASGSLYDLSYAMERTYSSFAWEKFMGFGGKEIDVSKLKDSCITKIQEVNELYDYVSIYFPAMLDESKKELDTAKQYFDTKDYALCLFESSKAEAEVDTALSALYIEDANVGDLLDKKLIAAEYSIENQIEKGSFPILGYSYYEYANVLKEKDKYTALVYAEYGIELSNLDIYFPPKKPFELRLNGKALLTLILGFITAVLIFSTRKKYRHRKIKFKRR